MTAEHGEQPEVEQRAAQAQQPALVKLGGPSRPAELVMPVAPRVPKHERGERHVWHGQPPKRGHRRPPCCSASIASIPNGSRPTSSSGGPCAASSATRRRSAMLSSGNVADTASSTAT